MRTSFVLLLTLVLGVATLQSQVTKTVGASGNYTTLKAAFDDINAGNITGSITLQITDNLTETASAVLNASGTGSASYSSVAIYPTVTGKSISGNFVGALIQLDGADNVTIDGRLNQTGSAKDLILENSNTSGKVIEFVGGATTNTIRYTTIKGANAGAANATSGVIHFNRSVVAGGNSNNIIEYNAITKSTTRPRNVIYSKGSAAPGRNVNNEIRNNEFFDLAVVNTADVLDTRSIYIDSFSSEWVISQNAFYETTALAPANANPIRMISIVSGTTGGGFVISGNRFGGNAADGSGFYTKNSGQRNDIFVVSVNADSTLATSIQGNTFSGFSCSNTGAGILDLITISGKTSVNIGTTLKNTFGSMADTSAIVVFNTLNGGRAKAISIASTGVSNISNNEFGGITTRTTTATISCAITLIECTAAVTAAVTVQNNTLGSTIANNIIAQSASTGNNQNVIGLTINGTATHLIQNNIFQNLTNNGTQQNSVALAIQVTKGTNTIQNNTIRYILGTGSGTSPNFTAAGGIVLSGTISGSQNITSNTIHNMGHLSKTGTGYAVGIRSYFTASATMPVQIFKNLIYNFTAASDGSAEVILTGIIATTGDIFNNIITLSTDTTCVLSGILNYGANVKHNTVYLGGSPQKGARNSIGYWDQTSSTVRVISGNIFRNTRSNTGTSTAFHMAAFMTGTTGLTSDYNNYSFSGNGGSVGGTRLNLSEYRVATNQDCNSKEANPLFAVPGGITASDYLPSQATLTADPASGITTDFLGNPRSATQPSMGALEYSVNAPSGPEPLMDITGFSPNNAGTGDTIIVTGTNINSVKSVKFGPSEALYIKMLSETQMKVVVPVAAIGRITATSVCRGIDSTDTEYVVGPGSPKPVRINATSGETRTFYYPSLGLAFEAVNVGFHQGRIQIALLDTTYESNTARLKRSGVGGASYTNVVVYPAAANILVYNYDGNVNRPLVELDGAKNVKIDGRLNLSGSQIDMKFSLKGFSCDCAALKIHNDAMYDTIRYIRMESNVGNNTALKVGTDGFCGGNENAVEGNQYILIEKNEITATPQFNNRLRSAATLGGGTGEKANKYITFRDNNIFDWYNISTTFTSACTGIGVANDFGSTISGNSVYETVVGLQSTVATQPGFRAISVAGNQTTVRGNFVGGTAPKAGGGQSTITFKGNAVPTSLYITGGPVYVDSNVVTNLVYKNITGGGWDATFNVYLGGGVIYFGTNAGNIIGDTTGTNKFIIEGVAGTSIQAALIRTNNSGAGIVVIENNRIGAATIKLGDTSSGSISSWITYVAGTGGTTIIRNNLFGSKGTANSIQLPTASTRDVYIQGIGVYGSGNIEISGNTLSNIHNAGVATGIYSSYVWGINATKNAIIKDNLISGLSTTGNHAGEVISGIIIQGASKTFVRNNVIRDLKYTGTSLKGRMTGILIYSTGGDTCLVDGNFIHSVAIPGVSGTTTLAGILSLGGAKNFISNNIINLQTNQLLTNFYGIGETGGSNKIYHNTAYLGGSVTSGSLSSHAFYSSSATSTGRELLNNIFYNNQSKSGTATGKSFAVTLTSAPSVIDYNDYWTTGTGGVLGSFAVTNKTTLADWRASTLQDCRSINVNPGLASAGGLLATNYLPSVDTLLAVGGTGVKIDYNKASRSLVKPAMGALEYTINTTPTDPYLTSFTPTWGLEDTVVIITGKGFTGATAVTFNGLAAKSFTVDSDTQITATVPASVTTGYIKVTLPCGFVNNNTLFRAQGCATLNTYYLDADGDGYGKLSSTTMACTLPAGYSTNSTDCNDNNAAVNPGATEVCSNMLDDDCDGTVDNCIFVDTDGDGVPDDQDCAPADSTTYQNLTVYVDADGDGYGTGSSSTLCSGANPPAGYSLQGGDCNDSNSAIKPGATEVCDGVDNDCDSSIDEGFPDTDSDGMANCVDTDDDGDGTPDTSDCAPLDKTKWQLGNFYVDADGDGYGVDTLVSACYGSTTPSGYATIDGDCDDTKAAANPGATEICDGIDNDCDGMVDEGFTNTDGDTQADCVDADDDNDGTIDTNDCAPLDNLVWNTFTIYLDSDGDGYGTGVSSTVCAGATPPAGYSTLNGDCNDADATINPGATELCDGIDNDCDGLIDDSLPDADSDGIADCVDPDDDNDGIPDTVEGDCSGTLPCTPTDTDNDGTPDYLDADSDNDGIADSAEDAGCTGTVPCTPTDSDNDGTPDYRDLDSDGDGITDEVENMACDMTFNTFELLQISNVTTTTNTCDSDGDGTPNYLDADSDNDGIPDATEDSACTGTLPCAPTDTDNDGTPDFLDADSDGDGIPDATEDSACTGTLPCTPTDTDNDGTPNFQDLDSDGDGIPDATEDVACTGTLPCTPTDTDNDGTPNYLDQDSDGDGIPDATEDVACTGTLPCTPTDTDNDGTPNYLDQDSDGDGIPDATEDTACTGTLPCTPTDTDNDGTPNYLDQDSDGDGIPDATEDSACTGTLPCTPTDTDNDGTPNYLDQDSDGDGIPDAVEDSACMGTLPCAPTDTDNDGTPNYLDQDSDGDGIPDATEDAACTGTLPCTPTDTDNDGTPNYLDQDSDGDGIPDATEDVACTGTLPCTPTDTDNDGTPNYLDQDSDGDGIPDATEDSACTGTLPCTPTDTDNDGTPDYLDLDSDGDGLPDAVEDSACTATLPCTPTDSDNDGTPDYRDIDSDADGIPDAVEDSSCTGTLPCTPTDTDNDGTPDYLDTDSDGDGLSDDFEDAVCSGTLPCAPTDSDNDGKPDFQDVDSDGDGIPDEVEESACGIPPVVENGNVQSTIQGKSGCDSDNDGIPNYLDLDSDNDGIHDDVEDGACSSVAPCDPTDSDEDGTPDYLDADSDGDNIPDKVENDACSMFPDMPVITFTVVSGVTTTCDADEDGIPNYLDLDSDGDGISDDDEDTGCTGTSPCTPTDTDGDGLPDYLNGCTNPDNPGSITAEQYICEGMVPAKISSVSLPTGETGDLEYKWQVSSTGGDSGFVDIPNSNSPEYQPGALLHDRWYRRLARVDCEEDWSEAAISNESVVIVKKPNGQYLVIETLQQPKCTPPTACKLTIKGLPMATWRLEQNGPVDGYIDGSGDPVIIENLPDGVYQYRVATPAGCFQTPPFGVIVITY